MAMNLTTVPEHKPRFRGTNLVLLIVLVVLENATVWLTRFTRQGDTDQLYEINHLMLLTEAGKFTLAFLLELFHTKGHVWHSIKTQSSYDGWKVAVPAVFYFLQNTLFVVALTNLSAPVFQVSSQLQLIITAIVSMVLLGRRYTMSQWFSLATVCVGVALSVLAKHDDQGKDQDVDSNDASLRIGLFAVVTASHFSALAGVSFEKFVKNDVGSVGAPSLWMRNMQLAACSVLCAFSKEVFEALSTRTTLSDHQWHELAFSYGFTKWVWMLGMLRVSTGLVVAVIIRRMDNVVKGLTSGMSMVFGILMSRVLFGAELRSVFWLGMAMVVTAGYSFANEGVLGWKRMVVVLLGLALLWQGISHFETQQLYWKSIEYQPIRRL